MSIPKYGFHLLVIPEDRADEEIANGFQAHWALATRRIHIQPVAGGWTKVLETFRDEHVADMKRRKDRHIVLLIDFDEQADRLETARGYVPQELQDRVFVLGVWSQPEKLRTALNCSRETIGNRLADECLKNEYKDWNHALLIHNAQEVERLKQIVRPFLFPQG